MIIDDFHEILNNFQFESKKPFKDNEFANKMRNDFTENFKKFVFNILTNNDEYVAKISPGMTRWTKRPWAGLRNSTLTNTFKKGLYLIYIFDFENNGFHLSLDQGSDYPNLSSRKNISQYLFDLIYKNNLFIPQGFAGDENKLYEDVVLSKFYNIDDVTINEMENDLKDLINIYEYLIPYYEDYMLTFDYNNDLKNNSNENKGNLEFSAVKINEYLNKNNLKNFEKDEFEDMYLHFKSEFAPEILEKLDGSDLLNKIFLHDADRNNLCYVLEFSQEYIKTGSIKGGSAYKYTLYKNSEG